MQIYLFVVWFCFALIHASLSTLDSPTLLLQVFAQLPLALSASIEAFYHFHVGEVFQNSIMLYLAGLVPTSLLPRSSCISNSLYDIPHSSIQYSIFLNSPQVTIFVILLYILFIFYTYSFKTTFRLHNLAYQLTFLQPSSTFIQRYCDLLISDMLRCRYSSQEAA